jgi:hypothetical protein
MNRSFIIKFSCVNNLSDARFAAGSWADLVGFNFDPNHPQYIEPNKAKDIIQWLSGVKIVAEFGHQPVSWIQDITGLLNIQTIQIPSDHEATQTLKSLGYNLIGRFENSLHLPEGFDLAICSNPNDYEVLQKQYTTLIESSEQFNPELMDGVCFIGEPEEKPGTRNHQSWHELIEQWEQAQ